MPSAQYNSMLLDPVFEVSSDTRPWGGVSPIYPISASVQSIKIAVGSEIETATLILDDAEFGTELDAFLPIIITETSGASDVVCFRGFVVSNDSEMGESGEVQTVQLNGYKWLLSKRTQIRGKWYLVRGGTVSPVGGLGNGTSAGNQKYIFERHRSNFQADSGFLQNEQLVFNAGGAPDCFIDNSISDTRVVFYYDDVNATVGRTEEDGREITAFVSKSFTGFYWTWCTMIRHIHKYWIDPYNVTLSAINLSTADLTELAAIDIELLSPMDFSINGMNPLEALDTVVSSIPGKWFWYLEYAELSVTIRIKKFMIVAPATNMIITAPIKGAKIVNSNANISKVAVSRNYEKAVANVVGLGGKLKLVSTFKLVPLWVKFDKGGGVYCDFENAADFANWKRWVDWYYESDKNKQDKSIATFTAEQMTRYPRIYRFYGIPEEGETLGDHIVSAVSASPDNILLTGDPLAQYNVFDAPGGGSATVRDYFFVKGRFDRELAPPEYKRFSDKIQVFMYDGKYTYHPKDSAGAEITKAAKVTTAPQIPTPTQLTEQTARRSWVFPDDEKISYNIDTKNLTILFDQPQAKVGNAFRETEKDKFLAGISLETYDTMASRDVYITATIATDLAAVLGSRLTSGYVETASGAPFSAYVNAGTQDIIFHTNAWYPLTSEHKDIATPLVSADTMDDHVLSDVVRAAEDFDDFRAYIGQGHVELARALINWKEGYKIYEERIALEYPYYHNVYALGSRLLGIVNTAYDTGLTSNLLSMSWERIADSASYITKHDLANIYYTDRSSIDFVPLKHSENKNRFNSRAQLKFDNETVDGDMPTL